MSIKDEMGRCAVGVVNKPDIYSSSLSTGTILGGPSPTDTVVLFCPLGAFMLPPAS